MIAGVREILLITTPYDRPAFERLLGDGGQWGLHISYRTQHSPDGLAQAYIIGEEFLDGAPSVMILGDNIFYGDGLQALLTGVSQRKPGATVFGYRVKDPERYGVVEFNASKQVVSIEEKPATPKSDFAVTGLYFYDENAPAYAREIKPSSRGELEITSLNQIYLDQGALNVELLGRGYAWLDTGTFDSMLEAAEFVRSLQHRQGLQICSPEEIAFGLGYIGADDLLTMTKGKLNNPYYSYLAALAHDALRRGA